MAYGMVTRVQATAAMYDAVHAELLRRTGASVDGLLVHVGRSTEDGFEVLEVWDSKEDFTRYDEALIRPVLAELSRGQDPSAVRQTVEEFEVRGVVIPRGGVAW